MANDADLIIINTRTNPKEDDNIYTQMEQDVYPGEWLKVPSAATSSG